MQAIRKFRKKNSGCFWWLVPSVADSPTTGNSIIGQFLRKFPTAAFSRTALNHGPMATRTEWFQPYLLVFWSNDVEGFTIVWRFYFLF